MKTKLFSNILTSLIVVTLTLGTASFASAKGSDNGKTEQKKNKQGQSEDKSSDKKENSKKETKKKVTVKSKTGKTVEKRLNDVDSSINSITKSINSYFNVKEDGIAEKELSKKLASSKYKSYKGKLNAEINKLRSYDKQLAGYKKKNKITTAEYDVLVAKSKELQKLAVEEITRVKTLVNQASAPKPEEEITLPTEPAPTTEPVPTTEPSA